MGYKIPTVLNNFNSYGAGHKYVGISNRSNTFQNSEYMTETIDGAELPGEAKKQSKALSVPWKRKQPSAISAANTSISITQTGQITYRGSMQVLNTATQTNDFESIVVTTKGKSSRRLTWDL